MYQIENVRSLGDPQRAFNWTGVFPTIMGLNPSPFLESIEGLPTPSIDSREIYHSGRRVNVAGASSVDAFSATFYVNETRFMEQYYQSWRQQIVGLNGLYNYPIDYKYSVLVNLHKGNKFNSLPTTAYRLIGVFPISKSPLNLVGDTSDRIKATINFKVDDVLIV